MHFVQQPRDQDHVDPVAPARDRSCSMRQLGQVEDGSSFAPGAGQAVLLIDAMMPRATHVRTNVAHACATSGKSDNHEGDQYIADDQKRGARVEVRLLLGASANLSPCFIAAGQCWPC